MLQIRAVPDKKDSEHFAERGDFNPSSDRDLLFFPTKQRVRTIQETYINRGIPFIPDQITTLRDFCRTYYANYGSQTTLISDGQSLHLLSTILESIRSEIPFFFSRKNPAPTTLKDLLALRDILSQRRITFFGPEQIQNSEKCRQINRALDAYADALNQRDLMDATGLIEWTIATIENNPSCNFGTVIFSGFHHPLVREQNLIRVIRDHATCCRYEYQTGEDNQIFDIPAWFGEDIIPVPPEDEKQVLTGLFSRHEPLKFEPIRVGIFQTSKEEMESIAMEITRLLESGIPFEEMAIATPDPASSRSLIQGVFHDFGFPCQICIGEALNREPLINFFARFLSLVTENFPREKFIDLIASPYFRSGMDEPTRVSIRSIDATLREARIVDGPSWEPQITALVKDSGAGTEPIHRCEDKDSEYEAVRVWIDRFQTDLLMLREEKTLAEHVRTFRTILDRWVRPGFPGTTKGNSALATERERWAWERFDTCLTRLPACSDPGELVGVAAFTRYLNYLLEELVTSDEGSGVRVMMLQDTAGLKIPYLFLAGLVEGDIPRPSTRLPLLTAAESELLGSRRLEEVIRDEQFFFLSALCAGDRVFLSAPRARSEKILLTSPFLETVRTMLDPRIWRPEITGSKSRAAISAGRLITRTSGSVPEDILALLPTDQRYGEVAERILIEDWYRTGIAESSYDGVLSDDTEITTQLIGRFGPGKVWSPTRLETYATCPFRFFMQRVLYLSPLPEVNPSLTPAEQGTFIHDALCEFFTRWAADGDQKITRTNLSEAASLLKEISITRSSRYRFTSPVWHAALRALLGSDDTCGLFDRFLFREAAREDSCLLPRFFEFDIGTRDSEEGGLRDEESGTWQGDNSFVLLDQGEGEPVRIEGRIDRVDISPDGFFAIIDYKTGSSYPNAIRIQEGTALQLPLYLLALEKMYEKHGQPLVGIAGSYCEISRKVTQTWPLLSPDQKSLVGVGSCKATSDFRTVLMNSLTAARTYISRIRAGKFPLPETCLVQYCEFRSVCRFDQFRTQGNRAGDEE